MNSAEAAQQWVAPQASTQAWQMKAALAAQQPAPAEAKELGRQAAANTQQVEALAVQAQLAQVQVLQVEAVAQLEQVAVRQARAGALQVQAAEERARAVEEARAVALALAVVHQV